MEKSDIYFEGESKGIVRVRTVVDGRIVARLLQDRGHDTWCIRIPGERGRSKTHNGRKAAVAALLSMM